MNVFDILREKITEEKNNNPSLMQEAGYWRNGLDDAIKKVNEVEQEYNEKFITEIRNKAIDEFAEQLKNKLLARYGSATPTEQYVAMQTTDWCNEIAEQMRKG